MASMLNILESGDFSDITILLENNRRFTAHKAILSSRSGYFRALFSSGMSECQAASVELKTGSAQALEDMIKFLYEGSLSQRHDWGEQELQRLKDLIPVADYYQIDGLSKALVDYLVDFIAPKQLGKPYVTVWISKALRVLATAKEAQLRPSIEKLRDVLEGSIGTMVDNPNFWKLLDGHNYLAVIVLKRLHQRKRKVDFGC